MSRGMRSGLIVFASVCLVYWGCSQESPLLTAKNHQSNGETPREKEAPPSQNQTDEIQNEKKPTQEAKKPEKEDVHPQTEIIATPAKVGTAPLRVSFQAKSMGLEEPLTYSWLFGDGDDSALKEPLARTYGVGRFNVLLTVTDKNGKKAKASVTIESKCRG